MLIAQCYTLPEAGVDGLSGAPLPAPTCPLSLSPHSPGTRRIPQNGMLPWGSENPLPYFQARTNTSKISTNPFQMLHMSQKRARGSVAPETKKLSSRVLFHLAEPAA